MAITVRRTLDRVRHTLGGEPEAIVGGTTLLNEVGHFLCSMHKWSWLKRTRTIVPARASVTGTNWTYTHATRTLADGATGSLLANYDYLNGDQIEITGGTGVTASSEYLVASKVDSDTLTLESPGLGSAADAQTDIDFFLRTDAVALPSDFKHIISVDMEESLVSGLHLCTLDYLQALRTNEVVVASTTHFWAALVWEGTPPTPRLEIYPTPASNDVDQFTIFYEAGWAPVDDDDDILRIPEWLEGFYLYMASEWARGLEEEDNLTLDERLVRIEAGPYFMRMRRRDGASMPHVGMLRGGAVLESLPGHVPMLRTQVSEPDSVL